MSLLQSVENKINAIGLEYIYVICALLFGITVCILTPPYQVMDEDAHFCRAWQISAGTVIPSVLSVQEVIDGDNPSAKALFNLGLELGKQNGGAGVMTAELSERKFFFAQVPKSMVSDHIFNQKISDKGSYYSWEQFGKFLRISGDYGLQEWFFIHNTGVYTPLSYLPQITGGFLGKAFSMPLGYTFYCMRIFALLFTIVCVFFSMRLLPEKKHFLFILALMPMFLTESASVSADAVLYGCCILGVSWLISMRQKTKQVSWLEYLCLFLFAAVLGLLKPSYGVILLLYFLLPSQCTKSKFAYYFVGLSLLLVCNIVTTVWVNIVVYQQGTNINFYDIVYPAINIDAQKNFIMYNPLHFVQATFNTICAPDAWRMKSFIGVIGNYTLAYDVYFSNWQYGLYALLLLIFCIMGKINLTLRQRMAIFSTFIVLTAVIFAIEYVVWTPVGHNMVLGIQGRYFIPMALLLSVPLSCNVTYRYENILAVTGGFFGGALTVWYTYTAFY